MNPALRELVDLLQVEPLEDKLFRGVSGDIGNRAVFGGQVLGQALMAAARTVPAERRVHSLHAYFLRPGDKQARIVYDVDCIRDGGSFTTRRVVAIQHGRPIFNLAASFHRPEPGFSHAAPAPQRRRPSRRSVPRPRAPHLARLPERVQARLRAEQAIEIRPLQALDPFEPAPQAPAHDLWMRASGVLPDDPVLHQAMLAYASDFGLLRSALLPHGLSFFDPRLHTASLDHAMWFHAEPRMDDWVLYCTESPWGGGARGFCRGTLHDRHGRLLASVAQEGLLRLSERPPATPRFGAASRFR
ncbi:acyl-CoA thioesterase II [Piscinibacter sakaiensis]|uniref:acyl-CoA thioesterase n=1 Tax=Piscinibacter sakaiensis TaxID=1547922 RepID=UPI00372BC594